MIGPLNTATDEPITSENGVRPLTPQATLNEAARSSSRIPSPWAAPGSQEAALLLANPFQQYSPLILNEPRRTEGPMLWL
jgi:hypothetical protein